MVDVLKKFMVLYENVGIVLKEDIIQEDRSWLTLLSSLKVVQRLMSILMNEG